VQIFGADAYGLTDSDRRQRTGLDQSIDRFAADVQFAGSFLHAQETTAAFQRICHGESPFWAEVETPPSRECSGFRLPGGLMGKERTNVQRAASPNQLATD